jgi:hypothetical protein
MDKFKGCGNKRNTGKGGRMKPDLTQKELAGFEAEGKPIIAAYRRAYLIKSYQGKSGEVLFGLHEFARKRAGLPYTSRGRFHAITPETFHKWNQPERGAA